MVDDVFRALADPSRRELLDRLRRRDGQTLTELTAGLGMARQSVTKHLAVLEGANLVTTRRQGRVKLHYLNPVPINDIAERWISRYDEPRLNALADIKRALEEQTVTTADTAANTTANPEGKPSFVYATYIKTTPERLWQALTDPAYTSRYWGGLVLHTDWKVGSEMTWEYAGVKTSDAEQVVLEADPPRRLSYRWHRVTPEFVEAVKMPSEVADRAEAEGLSRVTFEIEPFGETCKLTVVHDDFPPGSVMLEGVSQGWPAILSMLKSLLETDKVIKIALPDDASGLRRDAGSRP